MKTASPYNNRTTTIPIKIKVLGRGKARDRAEGKDPAAVKAVAKAGDEDLAAVKGTVVADDPDRQS